MIVQHDLRAKQVLLQKASIFNYGRTTNVDPIPIREIQDRVKTFQKGWIELVGILSLSSRPSDPEANEVSILALDKVDVVLVEVVARRAMGWVADVMTVRVSFHARQVWRACFALGLVR